MSTARRAAAAQALAGATRLWSVRIDQHDTLPDGPGFQGTAGAEPAFGKLHVRVGQGVFQLGAFLLKRLRSDVRRYHGPFSRREWGERLGGAPDRAGLPRQLPSQVSQQVPRAKAEKTDQWDRDRDQEHPPVQPINRSQQGRNLIKTCETRHGLVLTWKSEAHGHGPIRSGAALKCP